MEVTTPKITIASLAARLLLTPNQLTSWSFFANRPQAYAQFEIKKRSGGTRSIMAPSSSLRVVQRRLLPILGDLYKPRSCVHGFVQQRNIVSNALPHIRRRYVLNVDLEDFFPSINFGRVRGALIAKPFDLDPSVATVLARLCCHANQLPQGAPTSPILANIVSMRLDGELTRLASALGCTFTRYADDLTFSTSRKEFPTELASLVSAPYGTHALVGASLAAVIQNNGFKVNAKKTRLYGRIHAQRVTGLTVNKQVNVDRKFVRQLRAMLHAWRKFGLESAQSEFYTKYDKRHRAPHSDPPSFARVVRGRLMYLGMVRGFTDPIYLRYARECRQLDPALFSGALDRDEALNQNVWILECDESQNQGTAFFLEGVGLVTCAHVLGPKTVAFHPSNPSDRYSAITAYSDSHLDIAVLKIDKTTQNRLCVGDPSKISHYSRILVAGYPNYGVGDSLYKSWGTVSAERVRNGVTYFIPSVPIAFGNSGGPVVDESYKVIGIAARGVPNLASSADASPDKYGVISIAHLVKLLTEQRDR